MIAYPTQKEFTISNPTQNGFSSIGGLVQDPMAVPVHESEIQHELKIMDLQSKAIHNKLGELVQKLSAVISVKESSEKQKFGGQSPTLSPLANNLRDINFTLLSSLDILQILYSSIEL